MCCNMNSNLFKSNPKWQVMKHYKTPGHTTRNPLEESVATQCGLYKIVYAEKQKPITINYF